MALSYTMIILDFSVDFNYNLPSFIRSQRPNYIKQKSPKVRKEKLMIEKYAAIISALSAFISTGTVIWVSFFRKTRRDKIDELKTEMQVLFTEDAVNGIINVYAPSDEFFKLLKPKFQGKRYKDLHQCA